MNSSLNKKNPSLTVGITTCYGDESILQTIKSVRNSKNVADFRFIVVSDRVHFKPEVKKELKKYNVELIENSSEGSQIEKQKQILRLAKTDLLVLTQDDVLLDPKALSKVIDTFKNDTKLTMVSILNKPLDPSNSFESVLNVGTKIANKTAKFWNDGDNYLSVIGRFMAFRRGFISKKYRLIDKVATSDAYYYLENKRVGGKYKYLPQTYVAFKNPQNMKEHLRKSSRFQYSNKEMSHYFKNIEKEYLVSKKAVIHALSEQFIQEPLKTVLYFGVFFYTRLLKLKASVVLNPIWEVDLSTKKIKNI